MLFVRLTIGFMYNYHKENNQNRGHTFVSGGQASRQAFENALEEGEGGCFLTI